MISGLLCRAACVDVGAVCVCQHTIVQGTEEKSIFPRLRRHVLPERLQFITEKGNPKIVEKLH